MIETLADIKNLLPAERLKRIQNLKEKLRILYNTCQHQIAIPKKFFEKLKKDKWHSDIALCLGCGLRFGWFCPVSSNHICEYDEIADPACDDCKHCHMPSERK